jgi:hypothetical protein
MHLDEKDADVSFSSKCNEVTGEILMATTGELRAIIEELQLVDIGEAASYLGEEIIVEEESIVPEQQTALSCIISVQQTMCTAPLCNCAL